MKQSESRKENGWESYPADVWNKSRPPLEIEKKLSEFKLLFQLTGFEIVEMYGDDDDMRPFTGKNDNDYTIVVKRL